MPHVFISYKREDSSFVDELEQHLVDADILPWRDTRIKAGEEWRKLIDLALDDSFALILVITNESLQSPYVNYEWSYAVGANKEIVPIRLKEFDKSLLHPRLEQLNYLSVDDNFFDEKLVARLRELDKLYTEKVPQRLQKAIELLDSPDISERIMGIEFITSYKYPEPDPLIINILADALDHGLFDVRIRAALGLAARTNSEDPRVLPVLREYLMVEYVITSEDIIETLNIRGGLKSIIRLISEERKTRQILPSVSRDSVANTIIKLNDHYNIIPPLVDLLWSPSSKDENIPLKTAAVNILGLIGDQATLRTLVEFDNETDHGENNKYGHLKSRLADAIKTIKRRERISL